MNKNFISMANVVGSDETPKRQCPVCGKMFKPAPEHAYYIGDNRKNLCCTYTCMRNWQKNKKSLPVSKRFQYRTAVRIAETGEVFESIKKCSEYLETHYSVVYRALMNGYSCKGYHIEALEEGDLK